MAAPAVAAQTGPSLDVLELPSATTMRFVLLTAAMLVAGLFVGVSMFNAVEGVAFVAAGAACYGPGAAVGVTTVSSLPGEVAAAACMAPIEHLYVLYAVGGAVTVAAGATVVIMAAPRVVARRHGLRDPGLAAAAATARLATFCADVGIRRPPRLLVGPTSLRDAFSLGRPGRYAIAVPLALVVRPHTPLFEVAMRHELAHIRHHDVALSWLARSVWYTLAPLLLLPVVLFPLTGDVATLPGYLWRAAVIAVVVALAARSALRSRELSADVAAARRTGPDAVRAALTEVRAATGPSLRQIMAVHPTRDDRIAAVRQPGRTAIVTMTDGAVVGFLTALALPVLDLFFVAVFAGSDGLTPPFEAASAVVLGPLAGATLGLGFWRQAMVARTYTQQAPVAPVLVGLAAGALAGQLGSLGGVGLTGAGGLAHPVLVLVVAGALTSAAALTAGVGEIWADAVGRVTSQRYAAFAATAVATVLFATVLWTADAVQGHLDLQGWPAVSQEVPTGLTPPLLSLVALALAVATMWAQWSARVPQTSQAVSPSLRTPAPGLGQTLATGAGAGLAAAAVIVVNRIRLGDAADSAETIQRFIGNWWIAASAASAAVAALALIYGRRGCGAGLLAGTVAAVVAAIGNLGLVAAINGALPSGTVEGTLAKDLALGLLVTVPTAAIVPSYGHPIRSRPTRLLVVCAALLAVGAGAGAAAGRDVLAVPVAGDSQPVPTPVTNASPTTVPPIPPLSIADYKVVARLLYQQRAGIQTEMDAINHESAPATTRVAQINDRLIPDLQRLLTQAAAIQVADAPAADVHRHLLSSLRVTITAYHDLATGLAQNDGAALARGRGELTAEAQELAIWVHGVPGL